jgi:putative ABC transport system ATP-binding protein
MALDETSHATASLVWTGADKDHPRTVHVRNLQHHFGQGELRKQVLYDNNLDVYGGEIVMMTGPSGSGKTTLLTLIGALRSVQEGSMEVLGHELHHATPSQLVLTRRDIGFIFQAHNLFESLTALQNVRMALELFNPSAREANRRAGEMLERLGLGHRLNYKPRSLSGGQKQRVAVARGLVHGPKLVLADEPSAALDEKSGHEVMTLFQELAREQGVSVLIVTHDNRILDVADRIVNMVDGRIKSDVNLKESALICEFVQKSGIFAGLSVSTLSEVADQMRVERHRAGTTIVREGDPGDKFYLIRRGAVEVHTRNNGQSGELPNLGEGDFFGEAALMTDQPRNATVVAKTEVVLYALNKENFRTALDHSATFNEQLRLALFNRK